MVDLIHESDRPAGVPEGDDRSTVTGMPNVEQVEYWDGSGGEHWVAQQARYDQINAGFGDRVVEVLSACSGGVSSTSGAVTGR